MYKIWWFEVCHVLSFQGVVNISPENQRNAIIDANIRCLQHIIQDPYQPG